MLWKDRAEVEKGRRPFFSSLLGAFEAPLFGNSDAYFIAYHRRGSMGEMDTIVKGAKARPRVAAEKPALLQNL
jgi:hypothetical protein